MSEPRRVTLKLSDLTSGVTVLEMARAATVAGVRVLDAEGLLRELVARTGSPADFEAATTLLYALAWQLQRRDEPGVTWQEAQTWRVEFDLDATDELAAAEAEAVAQATVRAARLSGLTPAEAGELTLAEIGVYAELAGVEGR